MTEADNIVLRLLQEMRADLRRIDAKVDDMGEGLRSEIHTLGANVASDLMSLEKRLGEQLSTLRRSVMEYHSTAVGHGMLFSELEERVRRIEQKLDMTPEPH